MNAFWTTFRWIRNNYFTVGTKNNYEEYEYSKHMMWSYLKLISYGCMYGSGITFCLFLWMRLLKHKGRKDRFYLFGMNLFMSVNFINSCK